MPPVDEVGLILPQSKLHPSSGEVVLIHSPSSVTTPLMPPHACPVPYRRKQSYHAMAYRGAVILAVLLVSGVFAGALTAARHKSSRAARTTQLEAEGAVAIATIERMESKGR
jgi:hypothetical protein